MIVPCQYTSFGEIPVTAAQMVAGAEDDARAQDLRSLPKKNEKQDKPKLSKDERNARKDANENMRRRRALPTPETVGQRLARTKNFVQDDATAVCAHVVKDRRVVSHIRFTHRFHYMDPVFPDRQPSHRADVD